MSGVRAMTSTNDAKQAAAPVAAAAESKKPQKRQAISGMIVTIILIGIVVSIGGILATTTTDIVQTGLVLDNIEIKRLAIQNTGTQSYVTGMVKNAGNTDITDAQVIVRGTGDGVDDIFVAHFSPNDLNSGQSATVNAEILTDGTEDCTYVTGTGADSTGYDCDTGTTGLQPSTAGTNLRLTIGEKYQVEVRAVIAGGGEYSQTKVLAPQ